MTDSNKLQTSLFLLRISVFLVFLMWTLDKFIRPNHAAAVYKHFYFSPDLSATVMYVIGGIQMVILIGFLFGIKKQFTYGAVLLFHLISTITSYKQYFTPYAEGPNLLFFAAWPMLAACYMLYVFRNEDTKFTLGG